MLMSNDTKERIKVGALFIFQSYKVIMGSMLTLFVPQLCEDNEICSISDNLLHHDEIYHQITLGFNFFSVLLFIGVYIIELRRENWCVKYLDIDHNIPDNNLESIIKDKPDLLIPLSKHNKLYFKSIFITSLVYSVNLVLSSIFIYNNYAGIPSITSYMSYVVLILLKIYNSLCISYDSMTNNKALSAYIIEFTSYNKIDVDHVHKYKENNNNNDSDRNIQFNEEHTVIVNNNNDNDTSDNSSEEYAEEDQDPEQEPIIKSKLEKHIIDEEHIKIDV